MRRFSSSGEQAINNDLEVAGPAFTLDGDREAAQAGLYREAARGRGLFVGYLRNFQ